MKRYALIRDRKYEGADQSWIVELKDGQIFGTGYYREKGEWISSGPKFKAKIIELRFETRQLKAEGRVSYVDIIATADTIEEIKRQQIIEDLQEIMMKKITKMNGADLLKQVGNSKPQVIDAKTQKLIDELSKDKGFVGVVIPNKKSDDDE